MTLRNYAETIRTLHILDQKALRARTWQAVIVCSVLVALGVPALMW